jgi:phage shock protein A
MKATYQASKAEAGVGEAVSGISESMTDAGMTMQRAQDKIAQMQARSAAVDELLTSGALPDITGSAPDDIQQQLNAASSKSDVDAQLAAMKAELASSSAPEALPASSPGASAPAGSADDIAEGSVETVDGAGQ